MSFGWWIESNPQSEWLFVVPYLSAFSVASDLIEEKVNLQKYRKLSCFFILLQNFKVWPNHSLLYHPSLMFTACLKQLRQHGQMVLQQINISWLFHRDVSLLTLKAAWIYELLMSWRGIRAIHQTGNFLMLILCLFFLVSVLWPFIYLQDGFERKGEGLKFKWV